MKRLFVLAVLPLTAAACAAGATNSSGTEGGSQTSVTATPPAHGGSSNKPKSTTSTTNGTSSTSSTTFAFGTTNVKGSTIYSQEGAGNATTRSFTVPSGTPAWDVTWSFSCPPGSRHSGGLGLGNFLFIVYKGSSADSRDHGASGSGDSGQGTQRYTDTGTFNIHVGALPECSWSLIVVLPSS